ncbi:glucose-repressible alcohol dehydrogenase transcriptional effector isoform X1 [Lingula anatina]|uniref:Glucose-repressible alcohol dehydrogenase transcriptional effector isoform X1 n=1 Tax=Lingula anatina TaxID=7574 RepID=A0A2R2MPM0_LINAN|nr:glucose-repressible alcohol dehydrogenase transcriptional effector isoform X1 [Lingula anatina]|eukprot:XP_023932184.1 glucose-repressible alcohol dehydrogenase transcriptional effector isoform X1 [Lingula anatina]
MTPKKTSAAEATVVSTDVEMTRDETKVKSVEQEPPVVKVDKQPPVQKDQSGASAAPLSALSPSGHKRKWSYPEDDLGMSPPKKRREVADESSVPVTASAVQAAEHADKSADNELGEYEVIQMSDVPAADSQEVAAAVPKLSQPGVESMETEEAPVNFTSSQGASASVVLPPVNQTVQKQPLSQPAMINGNNSNESTVDPLLNRNFIPNPHLQGPVDSSKKFSIVSYNILAECHRKRGDYSFTPEEYLDISYRHKRMMEELKYLDGDVLCLQEVDPDYYRDILSKELRSLGYEGVFKKRNSPHYNEGEATFWRTSRFTLVDNTPLLLQDILHKDVDALEQSDADKAAIRKYLEGPIVMLITRLRCCTTGTVLTVGNVHVIWGKLKLTDIQCMQAAAAVREVVNKAGGAHNPHIVCGDFNSFPDSCAYQLLQDGYLSDNSINQLQEVTNVELSDNSKAALVNLLWKGFQHTSPHLKSAYATVQNKEPTRTTFKNCYDYIWGSFNDQLTLLGVIKEANIESRIPSAVFPSDHTSIKAEFMLLVNNSQC